MKQGKSHKSMDFIQSANKNMAILKYGNISRMSLIISQLEQSLTIRCLRYMEVFRLLCIILVILMKSIEYKKFLMKGHLLIWCGVIRKLISLDSEYPPEEQAIFLEKTCARNSWMRMAWMWFTELISFVKMDIRSCLVESLLRSGVLQITVTDMKT